jgi:phospholipase/lecithinase/hemolysin
MTREVMQLALEYIERNAVIDGIGARDALRAALTQPEQHGMTNQRPKEHEYTSHVSYCRALEDYCDALEKRTEALPEQQSELYWAARTEHDAAAFMLPGSKSK